jgi:hypothetical protein
MDEAKKRLRSLDFFMGTAFAFIGLFLAIDGYQTYVSPALVTVERSANPGVSTIFVGVLLVLFGTIIAVIGVGGSGNPFKVARQVIPETIAKPTFLRGLIVLGCIAVYFFVLWERVPYVVSTFIFLAGMMFLFKAGTWWKILLIAGTSVAVIWYFFGVLALVPLP